MAADVTVVDVDTGVYFGKQANANSASGVMFYRIGQYSYLFNGENSENTIQGGFTAGFGGNVTIIYCHKCYCESSNGLSSHLATRSPDADRCCQQTTTSLACKRNLDRTPGTSTSTTTASGTQSLATTSECSNGRLGL